MWNNVEDLTKKEIAELSGLLDHSGFQNHAVYFNQEFLLNTLQKRTIEKGCTSIAGYLIFLKSDPDEVKLLYEYLMIGFSEFFRNPLTFSVLETIILPGLIKRNITNSRREIRIWSAACAAGHEVYSLAILLQELQNMGFQEFEYRIFASDANESLIKQAVKGVYPASAFNKMTLKRLETWFNRTGDNFCIKNEVRKNIEFLTFNLFAENYCFPPESIFGDFDLVICANVLFYYNSEAQKIILGKLEKSLATGGYIVTSEAERSIFRSFYFKEVIPHATIFRKGKGYRSY